LFQVLTGSAAGGASSELALAEHHGKVLAAHILISFGRTVTYAHGASSSERRELMAPHLLQWASIMRAKEQGFSQYDFFGVAPVPSRVLTAVSARTSPHPWAGITRFKEGFGGQRVSFPGAYDFAVGSVGYWLYALAHKLM
jgi:lipid II:glycine glycyltransferase (peptidoglycan interpeptide bridge formation enzyme)